MGGRKRIDTFKRDNLIVEIIKQHQGVENAIKSNDLVKILRENGYELKPSSVHTTISKIIKQRNLPIVSSSSWGYCWGNKRSDFETCINELQMKVEELNKRIEHLNKFII